MQQQLVAVVQVIKLADGQAASDEVLTNSLYTRLLQPQTSIHFTLSAWRYFVACCQNNSAH